MVSSEPGLSEWIFYLTVIFETLLVFACIVGITYLQSHIFKKFTKVAQLQGKTKPIEPIEYIMFIKFKIHNFKQLI